MLLGPLEDQPGDLGWETFKVLAENSQGMISLFSGPNLEMRYANSQVRQITGSSIGTPAEVVLQRWPEWLNVIHHVLQTGINARIDASVRRAEATDERSSVFEAVVLPLKSGELEAPWGVLIISQDVVGATSVDTTPRQLARSLLATTHLGRSLDLTETAKIVTNLGAQLFGGWCVLDLWEPDGSLNRIAGVHSNPECQQLLEEFIAFPRSTGRLRGGQESFAHRVARTGQAELGEMDSKLLASLLPDRKHAELLLELDSKYFMIVAIWLGGRRLGALSLLRDSRSEPFTPADATLADELAERAALALAHAQDFDEQRNAALTFQRSLLPSALVESDEVEIAARYTAGTRGAEVGGDWYDVIPLQGGAIGLALGDVEGHDVEAAALMGQLRSVVRAYAQEGHSPAAVIERTNRFLSSLGQQRLVTMVYVQVHPHAQMIVGVRAGHPPPLVVLPDGEVHELQMAPGLPLGTEKDTAFTERISVLPTGASIVLYSDGLVERPTQSIEDGIQLLQHEVDVLNDEDLEKACDRVITKMTGPYRHEDDVALLVARLISTDEAGNRARWRLPPTPSSAPISRRFLAEILPSWGVAQTVIETSLLLTSELMTNALRQSDELIELRATIDHDALRVEVIDSSHRMPHLREAENDDESGRGLYLVDALSKSWGVEIEEFGKSVWFELDLALESVR